MPAFLLAEQIHLKDWLPKLLVSYNAAFSLFFGLFGKCPLKSVSGSCRHSAKFSNSSTAVTCGSAMQIASIDVRLLSFHTIFESWQDSRPRPLHSWELGKGVMLGHGTWWTKPYAYHSLKSILSAYHPLGTKLADRTAQVDDACCKLNTFFFPATVNSTSGRFRTVNVQSF